MTFIFCFSKYKLVFCLKVILLNINKILILYYCKCLSFIYGIPRKESCIFNKTSHRHTYSCEVLRCNRNNSINFKCVTELIASQLIPFQYLQV